MQTEVPQRHGPQQFRHLAVRRAAADLLSIVGLLILFLDLFTSSSYKITARALGLCIVGGFLRCERTSEWWLDEFRRED